MLYFSLSLKLPRLYKTETLMLRVSSFVYVPMATPLPQPRFLGEHFSSTHLGVCAPACSDLALNVWLQITDWGRCHGVSICSLSGIFYLPHPQCARIHSSCADKKMVVFNPYLYAVFVISIIGGLTCKSPWNGSSVSLTRCSCGSILTPDVLCTTIIKHKNLYTCNF